MSDTNKGYAVITSVEVNMPTSVVQLGASAVCGVIAPDGSLVGNIIGVSALINYGDSPEKIRETLVAEIQAQAQDSALDVFFL